MSVVAFPVREHPTANQPKKDLYEIGEIPPLGHVPKNMYCLLYTSPSPRD